MFPSRQIFATIYCRIAAIDSSGETGIGAIEEKYCSRDFKKPFQINPLVCDPSNFNFIIILRAMSLSMKKYILDIETELEKAICLRNFPSQVTERHNKPEVRSYHHNLHGAAPRPY